ncbi:MAG: type I-U CRISPR-associated protein Csb2 [Acidobacteriota bacterium]
MLAIAFRFPAGQYHATPWGRHVNESDVEWPPAPWRILRALIATWHRKVAPEQYQESAIEALVEDLSAVLPVYQLPRGILAHSRHYMPVREGGRDKRVLIFDAFVRIDPLDPLVVVWPDTCVEGDQLGLLRLLLRDMGFLGRAESWVEASLVDEWDGEPNCRPSELAVDTSTGEVLEPVRLAAPLDRKEYASWRAETITKQGLDGKGLKKPQRQILSTIPERLIDALRGETGTIQAAGWNCPPGARFVTYQRPSDSLTPSLRRHPAQVRQSSGITTVRVVLSGKPLPRIEDAVRIGELVRVAAIHQADRLFGAQGIPNVLSGHQLREGNRHGHAFYLPEDADGDGHIDHVLVHAENGLDAAALRALDQIDRLWTGSGSEWRVLLEQYGTIEDLQGSSYSKTAPVWVSATPYLHPWFRKKTFTIEDQIARECRERGLPAPTLEPLTSIRVKSRDRRPVHFHRFRTKRGLTQPDRQGSFWRLAFPEPIAGPLALGFGCHFGLGVFRAVDSERGQAKRV